ncbi:MAG: VOC family protein [Solirubrobacteraceae bacterium]
MKLNHINLPVATVPETRAFFETYFGFRCIRETRGKDFVVLVDDGGLALALSTSDGVRTEHYPHHFHIGFMQDSDAHVDAIHSRLRAAGAAVDEPKNLHGAWAFYFTAPGGIVVEVLHQH